jgi:hypothetical protein
VTREVRLALRASHDDFAGKWRAGVVALLASGEARRSATLSRLGSPDDLRRRSGEAPEVPEAKAAAISGP